MKPTYLPLFVYFFAYFLLAFVWRSVLVYRRTGINPVVLPSSADAYGYVGRAFKFLMIAAALLVCTLAFAPISDAWFGPYEPLRHSMVATLGWGLLIVSLLWMLVAQAQMGASWRIGIDAARRTELVQRGLFTVSRNPIFLAMRINLFGLLLVFPSAVTLAIFVAGEVLMQVQVRLEEQHLRSLHGDLYQRYASKVRRWI